MIAPYTVVGIPEFGKFWNPESWALESGIQLMDSGPEFHFVMIGVRNPISTD